MSDGQAVRVAAYLSAVLLLEVTSVGRVILAVGFARRNLGSLLVGHRVAPHPFGGLLLGIPGTLQVQGVSILTGRQLKLFCREKLNRISLHNVSFRSFISIKLTVKEAFDLDLSPGRVVFSHVEVVPVDLEEGVPIVVDLFV